VTRTTQSHEHMARRRGEGDPPARATLGTMAVMLALVALSLLIVMGLFWGFGVPIRGTHTISGAAMPWDRPAKKADDDMLGYGWADRDANRARIPIDRAMELIAQHGWPDSATKDGATKADQP